MNDPHFKLIVIRSLAPERTAAFYAVIELKYELAADFICCYWTTASEKPSYPLEPTV
jgi:hypothetical protein